MKPPSSPAMTSSTAEPAAAVSLARFVQDLRDARDMTQRQLAAKAILPLNLIEDVEAGLVLFLSPDLRQRLARVLRVRPIALQELECKPPNATLPVPRNSVSAQQALSALMMAIINDTEADHACPDCKAAIRVQSYERTDLKGRPMTTLKVHCSACLFRDQYDITNA